MSVPSDVKGWRARLATLSERGPGAVDLVDEAVALAETMQTLANARASASEERELERVARLMEDPTGRVLTTALTDQALRARRARRVSDQLNHLLDLHGLPHYMSGFERLQLRLFKLFGGAAPGLLVPAVLKRIRGEMKHYVLSAEPDRLHAQLEERARQGARLNLNQLGEAILGEDEAEARLARYLDAVRRPDVASVSVKISSIASQLELLAWDHTLDVLADRLRRLYRAAIAAPITDAAGRSRPKAVNLDMEEYRDLHLTLDLFRRVLGEDEFLGFEGGVVLQAYLPDSFSEQQALTKWALARVARGGAPIRLRFVKGANLAMERVDAAVHRWAQAPFLTKAEVDANYKRMLSWAATPERAAAVHVGIASHNLFDIAYGLVLRAARGVSDAIEFETLEGISVPLRRVVQELAGDVLVYAPAVAEDDMQSAIAYLIRRLDENTAPDNFLRHSFHLTPGDAEWREQERRFRASVRDADAIASRPRRDQHREIEPPRPPLDAPFSNEPDTDWALPHNRAWIAGVLARWREREPSLVPLQIGGELVEQSAAGIAEGVDPSRPGFVPYRYVLADWALVDRALDHARAELSGWGATTTEERSRVLAEVAQGLRRARGELIGAMMLDGGKAVPQADPEVSEAIDFAEYYRRSLAEFEALDGISLRPRGVVLVTPPWNFPLAIPAGGVLAALMAGNSVILKPSRHAALVAWEMCRVMWDAGVPRGALQLLVSEREVGARLVADQRLDALVLTGGTATARRFRELRPDLHLLAETGGKNATIVTDLADADLAIKHTLLSAFGHSGQKCSATSLLILEAPVYDDADFMRRLADGCRSLHVGSAWDPASKVTPLIRPPGAELARGLTTLEPGESWLVEPRVDPDNPRLWSPGIKLGVKPGSFCHQTELFGPVLSVMRAADLDDAIALTNGTPYGLTSGLQSLDDREIARWAETIEAGNLYVCRPTVGAIVERQPFGGRKASVWGPAAKAGGPNYVLQLMEITEAAGVEPDDARVFADYFGREHDPQRLLGQDNRFRYQPCEGVLLRLAAGAREADAGRVLQALRVCHVPHEVSAAPEIGWAAAVGAIIEGEDALAARLSRARWDRLRALGAVEPSVRAAAHGQDIYYEAAPVLATSRIELLRYLREQALSVDYHRFGNLGDREAEERTGPVEPSL